jgi:hypothetical protein
MKHKPQSKPHKGRGPSKFRKTEATRLVRAALDAGLSVNRVEHDPVSGRITVFPGKPSGEPSKSDFDKWMEQHARQTEGD